MSVHPFETWLIRGTETLQPTALDEAIAAARPGVERLKVDQFHQMIETGILREGEPIELIDGILVRKDNSDTGGDEMAHGPKQAFCVKRLQDLDEKVKPHQCHLRQQLPVILSDDREPEPDAAIVRGKMEDYLHGHPMASDCLAAIEVADSSLEYDRAVKMPLYAAAEIPFYLIVNIPDQQIEVYQEPLASEASYAQSAVFKKGATVTVELAKGAAIELSVSNILPIL